MVKRVIWGLILLTMMGACGETDPGVTREGAVRGFVDAMQRSRWDADAREEAFALIDEGSRDELARRASRTAALGRRGLEPWQMIAQGTFRLMFRPQVFEAAGNIVIVRGDGQSAQVPVVYEGDRWRVVLFPGGTSLDH